MHTVRCEFVANWFLKYPIAFLDACHHFLFYLAAILLPFQFALRGNDRFNEFAFWRILKRKVETLDARASVRKFTAQLDVKFDIAGKALQIIKDDNVVSSALRVQICKHSAHSGALHEVSPARRIIGEDHFDFISLAFRILTAAVFLTVESGTG
nr:hypothetical protein [Epibacterium ulvae]